MRTSQALHIVTVVAVALVIAGSARAAVIPVSESLQDGSLPSGLNVSSSSSGRAVVFDSSGAVFGSVTSHDNGRNYVRTNDPDYNTVSFQAMITYTATIGTDWNNTANVFFGLGTAEVGEYGVADRDTDNDSVFFQINAKNGDMRNWNVTRNGTSFDELEEATYPASVNTETHRLMMDYDAGAGTMTFSVDFDYAGGPFVADATATPVDVSALWQDGDAASIFFGGDDAATAYDLQVVPEPATLGLLTIGAASLIRRRRQA